MTKQNILANRIDSSGEMISYDEACKRVLSSKYILAWILKTCLKEFYECTIDDIVRKYIEGSPEVSVDPLHLDESTGFITGMNTESASLKEHTVTYDIKFRVILPQLEGRLDMHKAT